LEDLVSSAVSLAVASVPEGLPLLATATQLAAAQRLSKRNALVRNVRAIEALGRVDVICLDKTGTLTEGGIELHSVSDGHHDESVVEGLSERASSLVAAALRACGEEETDARVNDPVDQALWRSARRGAVAQATDCAGWTRTAEIPFVAARGYHATLGSFEQGARLSVKGAPEVILQLCTHAGPLGAPHKLDDEMRSRLTATAVQFAARGLRVLAVAEKSLTGTTKLTAQSVAALVFQGLLVFSDPVRPTSKLAIERLAQAGVRVLMVTGDHPQTGVAVASELGIPFATDVLTGADLARMNDDELTAAVTSIGVFARVTPTQKARLVRALQRAGRVVAMGGDGVNDAHALRLADVGVAVGEHSTVAARAAADVVLMDGRIDTLIEAIAEGRAMWFAVRDAVSILLGGNFGEIAFTLGAGLVAGRPPLNARQLLLVNLLTDVAPAMAIALRPPSRELLDALITESPDRSLGAPLTRDIIQRAITTSVGAGTAWTIARVIGSSSFARTVGLAALVGTQLGQTVKAGGMNRPVLLTSVGSAGLMFAIIQTPGLSHFFGCRPLGPIGWATAVGASATATAFSHLAGGVLEGDWLDSGAGFSNARGPLSRMSLPPGPMS
jgi:cation-transporting ATPase I